MSRLDPPFRMPKTFVKVIKEARADIKAGRTKSLKEVFGCRPKKKTRRGQI